MAGKTPEFPVVGKLACCHKCGRKILVERALIGVNHTLDVIATCWECLDEETQEKAKDTYKLKAEEIKNSDSKP